MAIGDSLKCINLCLYYLCITIADTKTHYVKYPHNVIIHLTNSKLLLMSREYFEITHLHFSDVVRLFQVFCKCQYELSMVNEKS